MTKRVRKPTTSTTVQVLHEVWKQLADGERLCYQSCIYHYPEGHSDRRYRFIRKDAQGRLKAQRGQAGADHEDFADLIAGMQRRIKTPVATVLADTSVEICTPGECAPAVYRGYTKGVHIFGRNITIRTTVR